MEHFGALNSFFEQGMAEILLIAEIGLKCVNSHESCPEFYPHICHILSRKLVMDLKQKNYHFSSPAGSRKAVFRDSNIGPRIGVRMKFIRAPHRPHVRQAKFCLRVCQVVFPGYSHFAPPTDWLVSI